MLRPAAALAAAGLALAAPALADTGGEAAVERTPPPAGAPAPAPILDSAMTGGVSARQIWELPPLRPTGGIGPPGETAAPAAPPATSPRPPRRRRRGRRPRSGGAGPRAVAALAPLPQLARNGSSPETPVAGRKSLRELETLTPAAVTLPAAAPGTPASLPVTGLDALLLALLGAGMVAIGLATLAVLRDAERLLGAR